MLGRAVSLALCSVMQRSMCVFTPEKNGVWSGKRDSMFLGFGGRRLQELNSVVCLTDKILLDGERALCTHLVGKSSGADSHCISQRQGLIWKRLLASAQLLGAGTQNFLASDRRNYLPWSPGQVCTSLRKLTGTTVNRGVFLDLPSSAFHGRSWHRDEMGASAHQQDLASGKQWLLSQPIHHACKQSVGAGIPADFLEAMKGAAFLHGSVTMFKIKLKTLLACCSVSRSLDLFSPRDFPIKWGPGPIEISRSCLGDLSKPRIFICNVPFVWLFPKHNIKLPKKGKLILKSLCNLII